MKSIPAKIILAVVLAGSTLSLRAADQPPLNENLKPLKMLLGDWKVRWVENGQSMSGKTTVKPDAGGSIITLKFETLDEDGKTIFSTVSIFHWQSETKSLAEVHFYANGAHGSNVLVNQTDDKLVWQGQRYTPEGKPSWGSMEMIKINENTWSVQFVRISYQGASLPDGPKLNFTRAQ